MDDEEIHCPTILYKYRDWDNAFHRKILIENKVYLASPREFEDTNDCNLPEVFPEKDELYGFFLNYAEKKYPNWPIWARRVFARYWSKRSPLAHPEQLSKINTEYTKKFYDRFGVLSLTIDCNNDAMWEKYAKNYKGFCIGFDTELFFSILGKGKYVEYVDELPPTYLGKDDPKAWHLKNNFLKEKKWSFEKEYREYMMWEYTATDKDRNVKLPENCIVEVILGKDMPPHQKEEIREIVRNKHPQAKIVDNSFA